MMSRMAGFQLDLFRRPKLSRTIEFVTLIPATVLLGPLLLYGMFGMLLACAGVLMSVQSWQVKIVTVKLMLLVLARMLVGCASLACLWVLLMGGVNPVRRRPVLRGSAIILLVLGMADGLYFLFSDPGVTKAVLSGRWSILMWAAVLILPMLDAIRYVCLLLAPARSKKAASPLTR
jgi:hypothetical protein